MDIFEILKIKKINQFKHQNSILNKKISLLVITYTDQRHMLFYYWSYSKIRLGRWNRQLLRVVHNSQIHMQQGQSYSQYTNNINIQGSSCSQYSNNINIQGPSYSQYTNNINIQGPSYSQYTNNKNIQGPSYSQHTNNINIQGSSYSQYTNKYFF